MSLDFTAFRLDGYFSAIAALKDDGTSFSCIEVQGNDAATAWPEVAQSLGLSGTGGVVSPSELTASNLPKSLEQWIVNRIRPMSEADNLPLDPRLVHGLCDELVEIFGSAPHWFDVRISEHSSALLHLGAFWNIYLFGKNEKAYALHCAWDS